LCPSDVDMTPGCWSPLRPIPWIVHGFPCDFHTSVVTARTVNSLPVSTAANPILDAGRVRRARTLTLVWLATAVFTSVLMPGIGVLREGQPLWAVLGSIGIVLFAATQAGVLYGAVTPEAGGWRWRLAFAAASVLSIPLVGPVAAGSWQTWAWIGAGIVGVLPLVLRPSPAIACAALVCGVGVGVALVTGSAPIQALLIIIVIGCSIAIINVGPIWLWRVIADAQSARGAVAALAISEERLRFAREVHDVLGHRLTVIALKAELLERSTDPPQRQVQDEAAEIRRLAASALEEVRSTVADSRRIVLTEELAALGQVLEASGVRSEIRLSTGVPDTCDAVLARVLREAVTNVLRHSRAEWCEITVERVGGEIVLSVRNDGVMHRSDSEQPRGSGLDGIRERLREHGGSLTVIRIDERFELHATMNAPS
jgi:two-component system sensor histidine kinase DesK